MDPLAQLASLLFFVVTLGYAFTCAVWPFGPCRRCQGTGRRGPSRRMYRLCHRCHGTGRRIRIGRHLWNDLRRLQRDTK